MLIDATLPMSSMGIRPLANELEAAGYDGLWAGETKHEPFMQMLQAAEATTRVSVGSSVVIAFARSPMTLASAAYDLAQYAEGRFVLGLGSQVKAHIERRFSMPWSEPVSRMREFVHALRAIWSSWQDGTRLRFEGDHYTCTLMTPFFSPPPHAFGPPPVYLAGVGAQMSAVAGEVGDGYLSHGFTSGRFFRECTLPNLLRGRQRAGHADLSGFTVVAPVLLGIGETDEQVERATAAVRQQVAFYASTPDYRSVLDLHGWGSLQPELQSLAKQGRWGEMGGLVDDTVLDAFAVVGSSPQAAAVLLERWRGMADRVSLYSPEPVPLGVVTRFLASLHDTEATAGIHD